MAGNIVKRYVAHDIGRVFSQSIEEATAENSAVLEMFCKTIRMKAIFKFKLIWD
jgi:hypothetical protein